MAGAEQRDATSALRDGSWVHIDAFDEAEELRTPPFEAGALRLIDLWPIPPAPEQT